MERGCRHMGGIWYQDVPRKHLICLLSAQVQNAALSAIEAYRSHFGSRPWGPAVGAAQAGPIRCHSQDP